VLYLFGVPHNIRLFDYQKSIMPVFKCFQCSDGQFVNGHCTRCCPSMIVQRDSKTGLVMATVFRSPQLYKDFNVNHLPGRSCACEGDCVRGKV
jgi:hypothetical protein